MSAAPLLSPELLTAAPELLAFAQKIARLDPRFAKGSAKARITEARVLVAKATGERFS